MASVRRGMTAPLDFTEALLSRSPVTVRRRVLWGECDPAGVVYTPRFTDYAAAARDWFLREGVGVVDRPHPDRISLAYPMRAMSFEFTSFLAADDFFDMTVYVADISRRTFSMAILATDVAKNVPSFQARLTSVCVDRQTGKSVSLPDEVRAALERYSASSPYLGATT